MTMILNNANASAPASAPGGSLPAAQPGLPADAALAAAAAATGASAATASTAADAAAAAAATAAQPLFAALLNLADLAGVETAPADDGAAPAAPEDETGASAAAGAAMASMAAPMLSMAMVLPQTLSGAVPTSQPGADQFARPTPRDGRVEGAAGSDTSLPGAIPATVAPLDQVNVAQPVPQSTTAAGTASQFAAALHSEQQNTHARSEQAAANAAAGTAGAAAPAIALQSALAGAALPAQPASGAPRSAPRQSADPAYLNTADSAANDGLGGAQASGGARLLGTTELGKISANSLSISSNAAQFASQQTALQPGAAGQADALKLSGGAEQWQQPLREALGERLQLQLQRNDNHAVIRLDPPNLGRIEISIRHSAGNLQVNLSASHSEVLRQLGNIGESMRQDLSQRQFSEVAVTVSATPRQGLADGDGRGRQGRDQEQAATPGRALSEDDSAAASFAMLTERE
ncbi:flagellar hook-length control protein FliK [Oxalobacteraceae bacterium]|nr:flagellar hook-length control protein FliK [Oxalobacteraceae bacterium]